MFTPYIPKKFPKQTLTAIANDFLFLSNTAKQTVSLVDMYYRRNFIGIVSAIGFLLLSLKSQYYY